MNKIEALVLLDKGKTLTHRNFDSSEWVKKDGGKYLFEDGVRCTIEEFWKWRTNSSWDNDWEEFKVLNTETCHCNVNMTNVFHAGKCIKCGKILG